MDALTVQNYETGGYTVVYVGTNPSQKQDLLTDLQLMSDFRPYLDQAIFNATSYANVQLYNLAAFAILREMEMTFTDVVTQLGQNKANAIEALCDVSQKVTSNMGQLGEQVDRGTMN
ncbi:hypothetical protein LIT32_01720 [Bacillus sp. CMF21]|nr:hypothetical protein LIT32_01720 [Bacillus sp. CMF21]